MSINMFTRVNFGASVYNKRIHESAFKSFCWFAQQQPNFSEQQSIKTGNKASINVACLPDLTLEKEMVAVMSFVFVVNAICFVCPLSVTLKFFSLNGLNVFPYSLHLGLTIWLAWPRPTECYQTWPRGFKKHLCNFYFSLVLPPSSLEEA